MTKISVKNLKGEKVKDITLADSVWNIEVNDGSVKKAIRLQLDASRQGTAKTKTRSEVSGGGRKPWKQKGTGRARQGSIRATQWRGGGISGGVNPRDYGFKINKKERALAIKSALSDKVASKKLIVVENLVLDSLKTKDTKNLFKDLALEGKILFVANEDAENLYMATRNLGNVLVLFADEINVYDIVNADVVVADEASLAQIEEVLK
ncbi:MAG: 50S ribosomal protein L4 [Erysipelotrichaceae bacterium]|nr:50S ribosomal protein L4 [Erysipelotrichaceae bacterium]